MRGSSRDTGIGAYNPANFFSWLNASHGSSPNPRVNIPHTAVVEYGVVVAWYFTSVKDGVVRRKRRKNLSKPDLLSAFTKGSLDGLPAASYFYETTNDLDNPTMNVLHILADDLDLFLSNLSEGDVRHGVLQKWVPPRGDHNSVINCLWAPLLLQLTKRTTSKRLNERGSMYNRVVTWEGTQQDSSINTINSTMIKAQCESLCQQISSHVSKSLDNQTVYQMSTYWKVDKDSKLVLLWCSSLLTTKTEADGSAHHGKLRSISPPLQVAASTAYGKSRESAVHNVPTCRLCGKTAGKVDTSTAAEIGQSERDAPVSARTAKRNEIRRRLEREQEMGSSKQQSRSEKISSLLAGANTVMSKHDYGDGSWAVTIEMLIRTWESEQGADLFEMDEELQDDISLDVQSLAAGRDLNPGMTSRSSVIQGSVPPLLKKLFPGLTALSFREKRTDPEFLHSTLNVCRTCYQKLTTTGPSVDGAPSYAASVYSDGASVMSKRQRSDNVSVTGSVTSKAEYPSGLLPEYCSMRTFRSLQNHYSRASTGLDAGAGGSQSHRGDGHGGVSHRSRKAGGTSYRSGGLTTRRALLSEEDEADDMFDVAGMGANQEIAEDISKLPVVIPGRGSASSSQWQQSSKTSSDQQPSRDALLKARASIGLVDHGQLLGVYDPLQEEEAEEEEGMENDGYSPEDKASPGDEEPGDSCSDEEYEDDFEATGTTSHNV